MPSIAGIPPARQGQFYPLPSYYSTDAAALLAGIEEKALRREFTGRPGAPLVSRSISHRAPLPHLGPLPPWAYFPPTGSTAYLRVYRKDVHVVRCHPETPPEARVPTPRAAIWEFSRKSRARLRHLCRNGGHVVRSQYLLTYHNQSPIDGQTVKRDLDRWLKAARRILGADLAYLWALEFQVKRGVPHFHIFLSAPAAPGSPIQRKLAAAWVRITQGTKEQLAVHANRKNWIKWAMDDGSYLEKNYIAKREQKDVPDHYSNVGRFWGASRNFAPLPTIVEPETVAPWSAGWSPDQVQRFVVRTMRRFAERCMNYDRTTWEKRPGKPRRSGLRQGDANGCHVVPYAAPVLYQLLDYMAEHSPDPYAVTWAAERVPF